MSKSNRVTLVTKTYPVSVLATCRAINAEAGAIVKKRLKELRAEPTRLFVAARSMYTLLGFGNFIHLFRQKLSGDVGLGEGAPRHSRITQWTHRDSERIAAIDKAVSYTCPPCPTGSAEKAYRPVVLCVNVAADELRHEPRWSRSQIFAVLECVVGSLGRRSSTLFFGTTFRVVGEAQGESLMGSKRHVKAHDWLQRYCAQQSDKYVWQDLMDEETWAKDWMEGEDV